MLVSLVGCSLNIKLVFFVKMMSSFSKFQDVVYGLFIIRA